MADGRIRVETSLDNKKITGDLKDLEGMAYRTAGNIKKAFDSTDAGSLKKQLSDVNKIISKGERELQSYQSRLNNLDSEKPVSAVSRQIAKQNDVIENGKAKIEEYQNELNKVQEKIAGLKTENLMKAERDLSPQFEKTHPGSTQILQSTYLSNDVDYQDAIQQEKTLTSEMTEYQAKVADASSEVERLNLKLADAKTSASSSLSREMDASKEKISQAKAEADRLNDSLKRSKGGSWFKRDMDKVPGSMDKAGKSAKKMGTTVSNSMEKGTKKIFKMGLAIFAIRSSYLFARRAASEYLSSNEQMANQVAAIWNVVAQAIGPVIDRIIGWVVTLVSYINAFVKSLTGVDLVAKGNAAALNKQAKATQGVADATKEANRQFASFDEMETLSSPKDSGGSGSSVPTLSVEDLGIDSIKDKFAELFEPLTNAWDEYGKGFVDSFKFGLDEIWSLIKSIGSSFEEVWKNGTGELTCGLILQILTNIFNTIGNIAKNFRIAWDNAGLGTSIVQGLWDILNTVLGCVNDISGSISKWSESLNFTPFLAGVEGIVKSLNGLADVISKGVSWGFENVLEPLGKWLLELAVPAALEVIAGCFNVLSSVLANALPLFQALWDNFLGPIAEWTGGVIVDIMNGIASALEWIVGNEVAVNILTGLGIAIGAVTLAIGAYNIVMGICNVVTTAFAGIMVVLTNPITLVVAAIAAVIAIVKLLVDHWDELSAAAKECWDKIVEKWNEFVEWITGLFRDAWEGICEWFGGIGTWFEERYEDVKNAIGGIGQWFKDKFEESVENVKLAFTGIGVFFGSVWDNITGAFGNVADWFRTKFSEAWTAVKNVFSSGGKVFDGIKDGILNGLKAVINALIDGINKVIAFPFKGINNALRKIRDISILGMHPFSWIDTITVPQIPRLAKGGIVNNPGPGINMGNYIAGERGPEAVIPLKDSEFVKDFAKMVASYIGGDTPMNIILQVGDKEFYRWFINMKKKYDFIMNGG